MTLVCIRDAPEDTTGHAEGHQAAGTRPAHTHGRYPHQRSDSSDREHRQSDASCSTAYSAIAMGRRRTTSGAIECPDFSSIPELSVIERSLIASYVELVKAGRDVVPEALLCDSDTDCIWAGERVFNFQRTRLNRLIAAATDEVLKSCLATRLQCLEEAWTRRTAQPTSEPDSESEPDYRIGDSYLLRHYEAWREESDTSDASRPRTASSGAGESSVSIKQGPTAGQGSWPQRAPPSPVTEVTMSKRSGTSVAEAVPETPDEGGSPSQTPACCISSGSEVIRSTRPYLSSGQPERPSLNQWRMHSIRLPESDAPFMQGPRPAVDMNKAYSYMATFLEAGPSRPGVPYTGSLSPDCIQSMRPGTKLLDRAADILMYNAAAMLRARTGADVRVVPSGVYKEWEDWVDRRPGETLMRKDLSKGLVSSEVPSSMTKFDFTGAEYVLVARHEADHYSTLFFSNFGAQSLSRAQCDNGGDKMLSTALRTYLVY